MARHGGLASEEEAHGAGKAAVRGALNGAAIWGIPFLLGGIIAYGVYPMYRNLTFQFKVYIQMSGMTVGSMIEADKRMRDYEATSRRVRKLKRDQETWKAYEAEYEKRLMSAKDNH